MTLNKVLLGQSYFLHFDPKLWEAMQPHPPLGSLYAASYLRSRGYPVALFDAMLAASEEEWVEALDRHQPRFAVLFEDNFNYLSKMCLERMRRAAFSMLGAARQRGCTVIACGADASDHSAEYLAHGADFILLGEGEITLGELLDSLSGRSQQPLEAIQSLAFYSKKDEPGSLLQTPRRPEIKDLDSLPFPAWDLVDVPRYKRIWRERHGYFSMNMVTTRGCPFHCNWCAKPIWGQRYNVRSPENVVAELEYLHATYQPDLIWFMDDIFGLKPGWLPKYASLLKSEGWQIPFKCLSRVDLLLRPGEVEALKAAGCQIVWVGAESGSQKVLDAMDKGTQVEQIYRLTPLLHQAGLQVGFFIQFGYPGEEREDIEKTLAMLRLCQPDDIGISVSYPLPGTRFYEAVRSQLGERQNWEDSSDLAMLYQGPFSTEFYRQLYGVAHKEFRARKLWKALRGSFKRDHALSWRIRFHYLERIFFNLVSLPLARRKLNRLATHSGSGLRSLPHMLPRAASTPTPQDE